MTELPGLVVAATCDTCQGPIYEPDIWEGLLPAPRVHDCTKPMFTTRVYLGQLL